MTAMSEGHGQPQGPEQTGVDEETGERRWTPPARSDQAPGEEVVQVNDAYVGGGPPPEGEPSLTDDQHQTGG